MIHSRFSVFGVKLGGSDSFRFDPAGSAEGHLISPGYAQTRDRGNDNWSQSYVLTGLSVAAVLK